jgi:DNA-directed RNA polymerase specialized sigma24 family protein
MSGTLKVFSSTAGCHRHEGHQMNDFSKMVEAEIPRLRRYARGLTRNAHTADDLVQECLVRALSKQHLWVEGTDLRAWLFTIMHNQKRQLLAPSRAPELRGSGQRYRALIDPRRQPGSSA